MTPVEPGQSIARTVTETSVGIGLVGMPWWIQLIDEINHILSLLTGVCGLIIAGIGVWRLLRRGRANV